MTKPLWTIQDTLNLFPTSFAEASRAEAAIEALEGYAVPGFKVGCTPDSSGPTTSDLPCARLQMELMKHEMVQGTIALWTVSVGVGSVNDQRLVSASCQMTYVRASLGDPQRSAIAPTPLNLHDLHS